jgi:glycosyltransferase involved in cell wall biosynthesis
VDARPNEDLLVADDPQACAEAVLRLLDNPAERARLAAAGRARMLSHHAWDASMRRLDGIIERCLRACAGASAPAGNPCRADLPLPTDG